MPATNILSRGRASQGDQKYQIVPPTLGKAEDEEMGTSREDEADRSSSPRHFTAKRLLGVGLLLILSAVAAWSLLGPAQKGREGLEFATPNDLWAIHDLLLIGYAAPFLKRGSGGEREARQAAAQLARLLPALHPHRPCRERLAQVLGAEPGQPAPDAPETEALIVSAAEASWDCLPAGYSAESFDNPFTLAAVHGADEAYAARMPRVRQEAALGACRGSGWPRTCSYWVSMHAMAKRAEGTELGRELVQALAQVIAAGATMCGGCTLHFRALAEPALGRGISADLGDTYWANRQCSYAHSHADELIECLGAKDGETSGRCGGMAAEMQDVAAFRATLHAFLEASPGSPSALGGASAVLVGLHNLVTSSVDVGFLPSGGPRYYCAGEVRAALAAFLVPGDATPDFTAAGLGEGVPGFGAHHLRNCSLA